ncbi:AMP-dependent synthetase/ligase [Coralliovum pocilloporae]|uniref:AMP-dependent synthetase/ligase n=1 Tax=Coralliovum pocilloporae TaxID=3066369 RepID=UPI003307C5DB
MEGARSPASDALDTFPKLLIRNARIRGSRPAVREKYLGIWQTWTWGEVLEEVRIYSLGLKQLGVQSGEKVAIVGSNRPRLYWTFAAVQTLGAVPVPVYADSVAEEMAYVLEHAEARIAIVENQEQTDKVQSIAETVTCLEQVVYDDPRGLRDYDHSALHSIDQVQELGRAAMAEDTSAVENWLDGINRACGSDLSVMLYTSGTTGRPKGVMLSYDNLLISARNACEMDQMTDADEAVAYLPLAWVGDHVFSYGQSYWSGFCVACPESAETLMHDLREIGPSFFFAPPRTFETLLTNIMIRMEDAGRLKKAMFDTFLKVADRVGEDILNGKPTGLADRLLYKLGDMLVYGPLKDALGFSKVRIGYTAGEAIGPEIFRFYRSLGINLKQLYGQTEASVYVTVQPDGEIFSDTVGKPAQDVEIRIADNGEVHYRSPGVFVGYFKNDDATRDTKTEDGWVLTGDAGFIDNRGHLKIIDRAKDVGKFNDGAMFAPKYVENKLKFFPNVKEVVAFGSDRDFCTCFVNIDLTAVGNWAERNNIPYASYQELAAHPDVYKTIEEHVAQVNADLAREPMMAQSQIHRFLVLHKELDADDGELTRTQKVRRKFITERYGELIEALYDGSAEKYISTEVTFEDGRKGQLAATVEIRDVTTFPVEAGQEAAE